MSVDFLQVRRQVQKLGDHALVRAGILEERRQSAWQVLENNAHNQERLRQKVLTVSRSDPNLRCAVPARIAEQRVEALDGHFASPALPLAATIIAADGSQITPNHHEPLQYCLINVGAIQMQLGSPESPVISVQTNLMYDDQLYTETGMITEARLALMRDLNERQRLAELAELCESPVITFTDGPMELWGAKDGDSDFQKSLEEYLDALEKLYQLGVVTAGYVDKPAADLVVRLLEIALLDENQLMQSRQSRSGQLRGVIDRDLFHQLLAPGERSAVFCIQSRSAQNYRGPLELHFFYLNAGRPDRPSLARVEIPGWVAQAPEMLDDLHAVLLQQCRIMGTRPFPYLLHRAHEAAVVTFEEKEQVTGMIMLELRKRGAPVGDFSNKQYAKDNPGRTRFEGR